jgi:hypothetical protein
MLNKAKNLKILSWQTTVKLSNLNKFLNRTEPNRPGEKKTTFTTRIGNAFDGLKLGLQQLQVKLQLLVQHKLF